MKVSYHAQERIIQRVGIPRKAARRCAEAALAKGYTLSDIKGGLVLWVKSKITGRDADTVQPIVYGDKLFLFGDGCVLITVLQLPSELIRNSTDRYIIGKSCRRRIRSRCSEEDVPWSLLEEEEEYAEEEYTDEYRENDRGARSFCIS